MNWSARVTALVLWITLTFSAIADSNGDQRIVCYYTNWSVYRPGTAKYSPQNINPYLCTHLIYAFGGFTKDNTLKPFDKYQDIEKGGYAKFTGLKSYNKNLKTMLAIGGWNEGSSRFSPMVADADRRKEMVKNSVKFLRQNHFDGLDLDWEYPAFRDGGKPRDRNNYASFVQELREEFERESSKTGRPRLLLSMAIPAGIEYLEKGYDLSRLNEYLDFFNLLSYDYHSAFEPAVNHHSPLYGLEEDNEYNYDSELTIDYTINYLLRHEVTPEKIVVGIPTYGRSYTLYNPEANDIGAPADGPGEEGEATREKGYLAYYEICENIEKTDDEGGWEVVQPNEKAMGPYAYKGNQWVGYDDENIVRVKALYVKEKKLGGIMFWSIDNDDFRGKCHGRPYPLIEAAKEALLTGNEKTSQKSKPSLSPKKSRPHGNQRTTDPSNDRKFSSSQRRSGSKISQARKRLNSSRLNSRPPTKTVDEEIEESEEPEERNVFKESTPRPRKTRPRARAGNRRKIERTDENSYNDGESLSNKLTTPEPPTTPDPGSDFKCEDEGFFSHPRDCKKYFWCLDSGPGGLGIVAHQFTCPSGLVFNKAADSCDYPRNVVCPKAKPVTTTTRTPPSSTTRRTTTEKFESPEEEYEYEDELNAAEEEEDIPVSTTSKPLQYKTINRSRPTTTEATTTEQTTTENARNFKGDEEVEDEEDPRVLKELIDLIKKAGGIEQLEKQLHLQEKSSGSSGETTEGNQATPATISRSLYERVLNRQATRLFGTSTAKATVSTNARNHFQNGPGRAQFDGLDEVPEVKSLRKNKKPQYVTIARQRPSTREPLTEDDEEALADEEGEEDNADVASSEERAVSNFDDEANSSPKRVTPSYVNIRRSRPTTPASENDLDEKEEIHEESTSKFSRRHQANRKSANEEEPEDTNPIHQQTASTDAPDESSQGSTSSKSRYTNIHRFRSTTSKSSETEETQKSPDESETPTTPSLLHEIITTPEPQLSSTFSPISSESTTVIPTSSSHPDDEKSPTISTTHLPATDSVKLVENSVTEILLTTFPVSSSPRTTSQSQRTTSTTTPPSASSPRPFGYPRRTRPTSSTTPVSSTTEQNRAKVNLETPGLPTLKQLLSNNYGNTRSIDTASTTEIIFSNSVNDDYSDRLEVPVKILDNYDNGEMKINEFAVLSLLDHASSPHATTMVSKIQDGNSVEADEKLVQLESNRLGRGRRFQEESIDEISKDSRRRTRGRWEQVTNSLNSRRRNVRRRGNSRSTTPLNQDNLVSATENQKMSSTSSPMTFPENSVTTIRPTTLQGSSIPFPKADGPIRGFFITKSLDEDHSTTVQTVSTETTTGVTSTLAPTTVTMEVEVSTETVPTDGHLEWRENELDGRGITFGEESHLLDNSFSTIMKPMSTTLNEQTTHGISTTIKLDETTFDGGSRYSESTTKPEITTYSTPRNTQSEIETDADNYVNDHEKFKEIETTASASISTVSNNVKTTASLPETTYVIIEDKLNESNFSMSESGEKYSTTENYEATYFTTQSSFSTFGNEIEDNSHITTSTTYTPKTFFTTLSLIKYEEVKNDKRIGGDSGKDSTGISLDDDEEIFIYGEQSFPSRSASTRASTPFTPSSTPSSTTSSTTEAPTTTPSTTTLTPVTSPATPPPTFPTSPTFSTTTTKVPDLRRSRGRVRYRGTFTTTSLSQERKPRPVSSSIRRRPVNQRYEAESSENLSQQPSTEPTLSSSLPPITPKSRTVYRGRGRGRTRSSTTSTTEQSFQVTEEPGVTSRNEEIIGMSETDLKNSHSSRIDDQSLAESSYVDVLGEMNALRNSGHFLRRPATNRPSTTISHIVDETTEHRYSSKYTIPRTESYDQSSRAQELAVSLIDPSTALSSFETGKETTRYRGGSLKIQDVIRPETTTTRATTQRRRQRPVTHVNEEQSTKRSRPTRRPIIDYDYYEDEEVRVSVKPELKDKIYITSSGKIRCLDQGTFAHPFSCKKFITCAKMVGGHVIPTEYSCPNKLSFDPVGGICNWSAGLGCKEILQ